MKVHNTLGNGFQEVIYQRCLEIEMEKAGIKFASVHTDAERMAWSAIWSARLMGFDCVVVPYDMTMESEAMGNTISLYEDSEDILYPTTPYKIWTTLDEVVMPVASALQQIRAGKVRALAVLTEQRIATLPDVPVGEDEFVELDEEGAFAIALVKQALNAGILILADSPTSNVLSFTPAFGISDEEIAFTTDWLRGQLS